MRYLVVFLHIIFVGCAVDKRAAHNIEIYNEFKKTVSREVFTGFPISDSEVKLSSIQKTIFPASLKLSKYAGIFLLCEFDSAKFKNIVNGFGGDVIFRSKISDSCNFFISIISDSSDCQGQYLPVPAIEERMYADDQFNPFKEIFVSSDDEFLVFAASSGNFIVDDPKFITREDLEGSIDLKGKWRDGFSNGAIVRYKNRQIIYWIVVW